MIDLLFYLAPALTIAAALMTAANLGSKVTGWGFVVFTIGSMAWLAIGLAQGPGSLVWQNIVLLGLNLFGVWRWLGRQRTIEAGADRASRRSRRAAVATLFPLRLASGAPVVDRAGAAIGTTVDAMASCDDGKLSYFVVSSGGVGGVGETLRRLPYHRLQVSDGEIRFEGDARQFEAIEPIAADSWPAR